MKKLTQNFDESLSFSLKSLKICETNYPENQKAKAMSLHVFTNAYFALDKLEEAHSYNKMALEIRKKIYGESHY